MSQKVGDKQLAEIEALVRGGKLKESFEEIRRLRTDLPRALYWRASNIARRSGHADWGLRLLNPILRPKGFREAQGTPEEKTEYSACLIRLGARNEAVKLLESIESPVPETHLIRAFAHVSRWEYAASVEYFTNYFECFDPNAYEALIAKVNLASALVFERDPRCEVTLAELVPVLEKKQLYFLLSNVYQLEVQWHMAQKDTKAGRIKLEKARALTPAVGGIGKLLLNKLEAWIISTENPQKATVLRSVRDQAAQIRHWETVRDCDYIEALVRRDENKIQRLYAGTPYQAYRDRLEKEFGSSVTLPESYILRLGDNSTETFSIFDPKVARELRLPLSGLPYRALQTFCSDFYRPFRIMELYSELYPNEYVNPGSSADRIHQLLKRVRTVLEKSKTPLRIGEIDREYKLEASTPVQIEIPVTKPEGYSYSPLVEKLKERFQESSFSLLEASEAAGLPRWTVLRALNKAKKTGSIEASGRSTATTYHFLISRTNKPKKAA